MLLWHTKHPTKGHSSLASPNGPQTPAVSTNDEGGIFFCLFHPEFHFFSGRLLSSPMSLTEEPCGFISSIFKEV